MAQQKGPRKHHHNPISYLARFTDTGDAKGRVFVHDLALGGEPRHQKPENCGFEKDLYDIQVEGLGRADVETFLANQRDGPGSLAIKSIVEAGEMPPRGSKIYNDLMWFISTAGTRSPAFRSIVQKWEDGSNKRKQQNEFVRQMLKNANEIVPWLAKRSWRMWIASPEAGEFVTSDQPLGLLNHRNVSFSPGNALAHRDIAAFFPLTATIAIEGLGYDDCNGNSVADPAHVAIINGLVAAGAHRCVFSRRKDFVWANHDLKPIIHGRAEFIEAWKGERRINP